MLSSLPEEWKETEKKREERALEDPKTKEKVIRYDRRSNHSRPKKKIKYFQLKHLVDKTEEEGQRSATHAARAELVHNLEEPGLIVAESSNERTIDLTQEEIVGQAPLAVATQYFNIKLNELGPYSINYSRSGRQLLLGGSKGHIASFDWRSKTLGCEIQVLETTRDIHYLHNETMFAAAQKQFVYIYDRTGTELHRISKMMSVNKLGFLPYHFLLVSANEYGVLSYLDVSIGQFISRHYTKMGPLRALSSNPHNGVVTLGHHNGTVSMWTPNMSKPAVKMLCHRGRVSDIAIDREGRYMVTGGFDAKIRVWDIRQYKPVNCFPIASPPSSLDISQRGLLAFGYGSRCEIWKDVFSQSEPYTPYLKYCLSGQLHKLQFCPFEDCLGLGHSNGFTSIVVPGAGEANIDGLEVNPYQSKRQRQEWEVKALLEKIPADLIMLEPQNLTQVYTGPIEAENNAQGNDKVKKKKIVLKMKKRGRSTPGKLASRKQKILDRRARQLLKAKLRSTKAKGDQMKMEDKSILDRFKS